MAEYIDREQAITEIIETYEYEFPTASGAYDEFVHMIIPNILKNISSADVAPVRHGRWEENIRGDYCVVCSECGFGLPTDVFCWTDCNRVSNERENTFVMTASIAGYCPQCGAKMDEED